MRIMLAAAAVLLLALPVRADTYGVGTCTTAVTLNSSTASLIFGAKDVSGGRHYLLLQCNGTNNCSCTIGVGAAGTTATNGVNIGFGGNSWTMIASPGSQGYAIPVGEVDCIGVGGAAVLVGCDW